MESPKITWYAKLKDETTFQSTNDIYAGTCIYDDSITVNIQIWNNRYGLTEVEMLKNFNFVMYFMNLEDSALLKNCEIYHKGKKLVTTIENNKVIFDPQKNISGKINNGSSTDKNNAGNFIALDFVFKNDNQTIKENDLKQLIFEIVHK